MKKYMKYCILGIGFLLIGFVSIKMDSIVAWIVSIKDDLSTIDAGTMELDLTTHPNESIKLRLTSPTFLLDPDIITRHTTNQKTSSAYIKHEVQFGESVKWIQVTLRNDGNVPGKIGYEGLDSAAGIKLFLENINSDDSNEELTGMVFLIVPHQEDLNEIRIYQHILGVMTAANQSLEYEDFASLQASLNAINQETIEACREVIFEPSDVMKLDIFVWQEYYDGGHYQSQYDQVDHSGSWIYRKQQFKLTLRVYFGQLRH